MQHFEIMINAMLSWADEAKTPRKAPARSATVMMRGERDVLDHDEPFADDDFEHDEELGMNLDAGEDGDEVAACEPLAGATVTVVSVERETESEFD